MRKQIDLPGSRITVAPAAAVPALVPVPAPSAAATSSLGPIATGPALAAALLDAVLGVCPLRAPLLGTRGRLATTTN